MLEFLRRVRFGFAATFAIWAAILLTRGPLFAAQDQDRQPPGQATEEEDPRYERLREMLTGAQLTGNFTIVGRESPGLQEEMYHIRSVQRLPQADMWLIEARIRYGQRDVTLPIPLRILWAGDTPVITLSRVTIPGLGTYSARVVLHDDMYAGTWSHDEIRGHLFGEIKREETQQEDRDRNAGGGGDDGGDTDSDVDVR